MKRDIPDLEKNMLVTFGRKYTEAEYIQWMYNFERKCENRLIKLFEELNITAVIKTDPYSLPYQSEVTHSLNGESYINGAFEFHRVTRHIVQEILNTKTSKIRFYMFINIKEQDGPIAFFKNFGKVEYKFRYFVH